MSRYNRCSECYNMERIFVTGERTDIDTSECEDFRPLTNADRIRSMTDEELAFYIVNHPMWSDESACIAWLKESISGERK